MKIALQKLMMLVLVLSCTTVSFSQSKKVKKANDEYREYAFIDARKVYLEIVENGDATAHIYRKIAGTHYWNSEYNEAARWYTKLITEFPSDAMAIDYFRASQAVKSRNGEGDALLSTKYFDTYLSMDPNAKPRPPAQQIDYVAEVEPLSDVVNTSFSDFGPAYYGENKLVFASASKQSEGVRLHAWNEQPYLDLYVADLDEDGRPTRKETLSDNLNTSFHESSAVFTKDGRTVYFTRNNFIDGKKGRGKKKTIRLKLYKAIKSGDNYWTNVVDLKKVKGETKESTGLNSDNWSVAHPALSKDEKYIYFSSDMPDDMSFVGDKTILEPDEVMSDLWMAEILPNNKFGDVKKLDLINTPNRESFPFVSEDNNLYFASDGRDGLGGYDVYLVKLDSVSGMPVGEVKNLGKPANSPYDDFGFIINEKERIGYFSSNRANPDAGSKGDDIYLYKECEIIIVGKATNRDTGAPLNGATVALIDESGNTLHTVTTGPDGLYRFDGYALCNSDYRLRVSVSNCDTDETVIHTPSSSKTIERNVALNCPTPCDKCDLADCFNIDRIHFDFDMFNIRDDITWVKRNSDGTYSETTNRLELGILVGVLNSHPNLVISIESHTDSRGSHAYNEWLSKQRAISTRNWLIKKGGIAPERLCAMAFGETELVTDCPDGVKCTEEEHDKNRRSEYRVISGLEGCATEPRKPCITETNHTQWKRR